MKRERGRCDAEEFACLFCCSGKKGVRSGETRKGGGGTYALAWTLGGLSKGLITARGGGEGALSMVLQVWVQVQMRIRVRVQV